MIVKKIIEFIKSFFPNKSTHVKHQKTGSKATPQKNSFEQLSHLTYNKHKTLSNQEIKYLTEKAESCIDAHDLRQALKIYNQLVEGASPHPHFYKRRAWINRMVGQFDAAISDMNEAIELNPDDSVSYWERGACYAHKLSQITTIGKDEKKTLLNKILQDYKSSVQRNPSSSEGWLAILETDMLLQNWDDAISNYGACKPYIDSREYHLVRSWLGCLSLIFAGDPLEEEDRKPLDDNSIRLRRTQWCVSEIDSLLIELEKEGFDKDKLNRAKILHQKFIDHFSEPPMRFDG